MMTFPLPTSNNTLVLDQLAGLNSLDSRYSSRPHRRAHPIENYHLSSHPRQNIRLHAEAGEAQSMQRWALLAKQVAVVELSKVSSKRAVMSAGP